MGNGKGEWTVKINDKELKFEVECDTLNDKKRRYILRINPKDETQTKKEILVIMLNPSTANENVPDMTSKYLIRLCHYNGYDSITICNLFSSRGQVKKLNESIENGTANDKRSNKKLKEQIKKFDEVLYAWGKAEKIIDRNSYNTRIAEIYKWLTNKKLMELGNSELKGKNYPHHPMYTYLKSKEKSKMKGHKPWT